MPDRPSEFITCPRCELPLAYLGTKHFHEGGLFDLFKGREHYDVYSCPRCGRIEFFVDTVGEELRGETPQDQPLTHEGTPLILEGTAPASSGLEWKCPTCSEAVPDTFDVCWKCGAARGGSQPPA
jgi:hypothetical protein